LRTELNIINGYARHRESPFPFLLCKLNCIQVTGVMRSSPNISARDRLATKRFAEY
jgi:hypothetical protein